MDFLSSFLSDPFFSTDDIELRDDEDENISFF